MMDSRRWPRMACESNSMPSPSGPRWRRACSMACIPLINPELSPTIPAIPHMLLLPLPSGDRGFKHPLVPLRATLNKEILDLGEIVTPDGLTRLRRVAQCLYSIIKCLLVVQLDDKAGIRRGRA